jgi:transcriptional regulator with XRE-family HTH domain
MEEIEQHFANAVKFHRKRLGISQEAFAQRAGIHRTYASSVERGRVQVSIAIASQLADALEIPLSKLFRDVERFAKGELSDEMDGT